MTHLMGVTELTQSYRLNRRTALRWTKQWNFPKAIQVRSRSEFFDSSEVRKWVEENTELGPDHDRLRVKNHEKRRKMASA